MFLGESFEIVLCLGILYHLPAPDVFDFAGRGRGDRADRRLRHHVALSFSTRELLGPPTSHNRCGRAYEGRDYREFDRLSSPEHRLK